MNRIITIATWLGVEIDRAAIADHLRRIEAEAKPIALSDKAFEQETGTRGVARASPVMTVSKNIAARP